MNRGHAVSSNCLAVSSRPIAFMGLKTVFRIDLGILAHRLVPRDLCENRRCGNRHTIPIGFGFGDDLERMRSVRANKIVTSIEQHDRARNRDALAGKVSQSSDHCVSKSFSDAVLVNFLSA